MARVGIGIHEGNGHRLHAQALEFLRQIVQGFFIKRGQYLALVVDPLRDFKSV